jgi:anti-sigma-K factor RskA
VNLFNGQLPDRLAAEYVLGTLTGAARRRFDTLLPAHPVLRAAVTDWEARLLPMALGAPAVDPSAKLWDAIESRLGWQGDGASAPAMAVRPATAGAPGSASKSTVSPRKLRFWRAFSALASLVALLLAMLMRLAPAEAPMIVVLHATTGTQTLVAGLSPDRRELSIQPLQRVALTQAQSLELWALPKAGAPSSLGVISAEKLTALSRRTLPKDTKALAVSLEPLGGSPTGAPTGPVLFVGDLTL